jgi:hypothetical protein
MTAAAIVTVVVLCLCAGVIVTHAQHRPAPYVPTDAGEQAAAQAIAGGTGVIEWDAQEECYVRATPHPAGFVIVEVLEPDAVAEIVAREVEAL